MLEVCEPGELGRLILTTLPIIKDVKQTLNAI